MKIICFTAVIAKLMYKSAANIVGHAINVLVTSTIIANGSTTVLEGKITGTANFHPISLHEHSI